MALVLARGPGEGFRIGERDFIVDRIDAPLRFHLRDAATGSEWCITDRDRQEIVPEVFVTAGDRAQNGHVCVAITAPANVMIIRSEVAR